MPAIYAKSLSQHSLRTTFAALIGALIFLAALCTEVKATEAQPTNLSAATTEQWRKMPPSLPPPRPYKLSAVTSFKLANGLLVELVEDHRVPFVTTYLGIKAGSTFEPAHLTGLASMTSDMLTEGTTKRTSKQIAEEIDCIGGALKGASDYDYTLISGSALSNYSDKLLTLMSDILLNPSFPSNELKLKKTNLIQELKMKRSEPDFLQDEKFQEVLFGTHPYAVVAPKPEHIEQISSKDLDDFHAKYYLPNNAVLIVVGDFKQAQMKDLINSNFGTNWHPGPMPIAKLPNLPQYKNKRIYLVNRPGSVQSSLKLGNVAIKKTDPDFFTFLVANQILGGAAHSRLFLNIREQKGYTYGAYSSFSARKWPGAFAAEAEVRTDVTAPSLQEFLYELERVRNVKVSDKEIRDAKTYLIGSFQLGLETQAGLAQKLLEVQLYNLPQDYLNTYTDKIMTVTQNDIRQVAHKNIDADRLTIVVVGDADKIKSDLDFFAPVNVYEATGKPRASAAATKVSPSH